MIAAYQGLGTTKDGKLVMLHVDFDEANARQGKRVERAQGYIDHFYVLELRKGVCRLYRRPACEGDSIGNRHPELGLPLSIRQGNCMNGCPTHARPDARRTFGIGLEGHAAGRQARQSPSVAAFRRAYIHCQSIRRHPGRKNGHLTLAADFVGPGQCRDKPTSWKQPLNQRSESVNPPCQPKIAVRHASLSCRHTKPRPRYSCVCRESGIA